MASNNQAIGISDESFPRAVGEYVGTATAPPHDSAAAPPATAASAPALPRR